MRSTPSLAALLALALPPALAAQTRPLQTEQATTAPGGTTVLELGAQAIAAEPNFLTGAPRGRWEGPEIRIVHSPADNVELDVEWTARVGARDDPDYGSVSDFGDVALRAKVRLAGGAGGSALGARFGVVLPQTSFGNGLGPNTLRMAAQVLATVAVGRGALHANAGLAIHDEPLRAHEQRDFLAYGLAATIPMGAAELVAEVAGLAGDGAPGADERGEARVGLRLGRGSARGDVALRRGFTDATGTWGITAGVSFTF